ncbi:MAG: divalent-cation tolerance protein CutA [Gammaproteobacteria bacterium]|nr:divalent-cation tolerance protein CutA [Gammaproteobacteria bacterium]MDX2488514.1 divalent-cation tolerance protein CutA [Gammaproteobacteria bacterium]
MQKQAVKHRPGEVLLVLVSCPAGKEDVIALDLLEKGLAACINVVPQMRSFYRWQGKLQQDNESMMLIKCAASNYDALQEHILELHPYELPEIITVSIAGGLPDYLEWVMHPTKNKSE